MVPPPCVKSLSQVSSHMTALRKAPASKRSSEKSISSPNPSPMKTPINSPQKSEQQKRQRSPSSDSSESTEEKKKKSKPIFNTGEDVCRVSKDVEQKALLHAKKNDQLKSSVKLQKMKKLGCRGPKKFP